MGLRNDPYVAFCFDEAAYLWGQYVDGELDLASRDPKELKKSKMGAAMKRREQVMKQLMSDPKNEKEPARQTPSQFRDPALMFSGKMGVKKP